jgi:GDPmannose 4,6-dehydratase
MNTNKKIGGLNIPEETNGKVALVSGVTGQDGSFLSELLLEKGYKVVGLMRRASTPNDYRLGKLLKVEEKMPERFKMEYWDLIDDASIRNLIKQYQPTHFFNTAAMSHVAISFPTPIATAEYNAVGVLRILEAIKEIKPDCRFLQCSSSEMFGLTPPPQNENTAFMPSSPYGAAKVYAFHITRIYREAYGLFACNSICFNHEGSRRGVNFVTRKITRNIAKIVKGEIKSFKLGNLDAERDWGSSKDYVKAMEMIINHEIADDFVIATRETHTVREFLEEAFSILGLKWEDYVVSSDEFKRPLEVPALLGEPKKFEDTFKWSPPTKFRELVLEMLVADLKEIANMTLDEAQKRVEDGKKAIF